MISRKYRKKPDADFSPKESTEYRDEFKGRPIPTNDIWIAANAVKHGLALYSSDSPFKEIEGLVLLPGMNNGARL